MIHVNKQPEPRRGAQGGTAILLSIRPEHAERIFQGSKSYELRKVIPSFPFNRVFLYETGGRGVVGCFEVGRVLNEPIKRLWSVVGNAATTRDRFFEYFKTVGRGYAIEVKNPTRFREPIGVGHLNGQVGMLSPPQNFMALHFGDALYSVLERARAMAVQKHPPQVHLSRILRKNRDEYRRLVFRHISPNYEQIDESFAESALRIHDLGVDPTGFFTTKKEILEIRDRRQKLIGFTTLTFKSGGCVKTGPTILLKPYRRKGYGLATRRAIEEHIRPMNPRKIYCTCPEGANQVVRYLLSSGMRIEAHLERHYATTHNELVFGKLLVADEPPPLVCKPPLPNTKGELCDPRSIRRSILVRDFADLFTSTWSSVSDKFAEAMVEQAVYARATAQSSKPKRLVCLGHRRHCIGAVVLLPKRGGAVKGVLLRGTGHAASLRTLLDEGCNLARDLKGRKLYFIHPLLDAAATALMRCEGFQTEGVIRAPYRPGQDAVVLSKFL